MRQLYKQVIGALFFLITLLACSNEEDTLSNLSELNSFSVQELMITFQQDATGNWYSKANKDDDLSELTAEFEISPQAMMFIGNTPQTSGYNKNDFTNPVIYTVRAEDGTKTNYKVSVFKEAFIASFGIKELADVEFINTSNDIIATVVNGTDLSALTAVFEATEGAKLYVNGVEQESGKTVNDFTKPLIYKLIEIDGTEKDYTVTISVAENQAPIADAGDDKTILVNPGQTTAVVQLDGSGSSDAEGAIATYEWKRGNAVIASGIKSEVLLEIGTHEIELWVRDEHGETAFDNIYIIVQEAGVYVPIDGNATQDTKNLLTNLGMIGNSSEFIFGQEFPLSFQQNELSYDLTTSDCKTVTGDHPGVFGIDPHYMLYKSASQRQLHIDEAKKAYENGSVITFDFHQQSKTDHKIYMSDITTSTDKSLMYDIVNDNNEARAWFYEELDDVIGIINNDLGFPIVFRLFHEMDGDWFWWGTKATNHSKQLYIEFYKMSVDYIKERTSLVLFAWSPNYTLQEDYYPGDDYVDIVGIDMYEPAKSTLKSNLIALSNFAISHNKIAALTETGYRNDYISSKPAFWNDVVLEAIKEGGNDIRIAWVLSWFNAPWTSNQSDLFIPNAETPQAAKDKFIEFENDATTLFQEDVRALQVYE
ncbi:glycosyl hydrolase [Saccharicrinis fermentans]|uniref:Mannan endo-1,4-beta-mannosidase n=1 Tax=Saccharicrinis fermentans DSM 9555 = JCM 21142 TaxID=869213 RepID=W7YNY4_9BACT|nr:glycosyl hydrolase [Saccharicrinis fermentans]GAF04104.1 mannan endo-1,4-beta-mannosidase precursor [Saccharicrinis fermentans DSM 9555 = JCM 21142]